jgi:hypothetical protein
MVHYEMGIEIGELSLPPDFGGVLLWGLINNRPFLRCLHGYGLCLWRLGKSEEAQTVFERILSLNPNDNQGVRSCWADVMRGRKWDEMMYGGAQWRGKVDTTKTRPADAGATGRCPQDAPPRARGVAASGPEEKRAAVENVLRLISAAKSVDGSVDRGRPT